MRKKVPTPTFSEKPLKNSKVIAPSQKKTNTENQCPEKWTEEVTDTAKGYRRKLAAMYGNDSGSQDLQHPTAKLAATLAKAGSSTHPCPSHARHGHVPSPACAPPPQLLPPHASPLSAAQAPPSSPPFTAAWPASHPTAPLTDAGVSARRSAPAYKRTPFTSLHHHCKHHPSSSPES